MTNGWADDYYNKMIIMNELFRQDKMASNYYIEYCICFICDCRQCVNGKEWNKFNLYTTDSNQIK